MRIADKTLSVIDTPPASAASFRLPRPKAWETMAVVATERPIEREVAKNWTADANPTAAVNSSIFSLEM